MDDYHILDNGVNRCWASALAQALAEVHLRVHGETHAGDMRRAILDSAGDRAVGGRQEDAHEEFESLLDNNAPVRRLFRCRSPALKVKLCSTGDSRPPYSVERENQMDRGRAYEGRAVYNTGSQDAPFRVLEDFTRVPAATSEHCLKASDYWQSTVEFPANVVAVTNTLGMIEEVRSFSAPGDEDDVYDLVSVLRHSNPQLHNVLGEGKFGHYVADVIRDDKVFRLDSLLPRSYEVKDPPRMSDTGLIYFFVRRRSVDRLLRERRERARLRG